MKWPPKTKADMLALQQAYGRDDAIAKAVGRDISAVCHHRTRFRVKPFGWRQTPREGVSITSQKRDGPIMPEAKIAELFAGRRF